MKFKVNPEKGNVLLMVTLIFLLLVTCGFWLVLREYLYFIIYFILTIMISHMYFFTSYFIKENFFMTKLGFIRIKIKYSDIKSVEILQNKDAVKLNLVNFSFKIYPSNKEIFVAKINSKLTNKNSHNIIDKK